MIWVCDSFLPRNRSQKACGCTSSFVCTQTHTHTQAGDALCCATFSADPLIFFNQFWNSRGKQTSSDFCTNYGDTVGRNVAYNETGPQFDIAIIFKSVSPSGGLLPRPPSVCHATFPIFAGASGGVPRRQPHRRSGLATLPSVGAVP